MALRRRSARLAAVVAAALPVLLIGQVAQAKLIPIPFTHYTITASAAATVPYGQPMVISSTVTPAGTAVLLSVEEQQPDSSWLQVGTAQLTAAGSYVATESCTPGTHVMRIVRYPHALLDVTSYSPTLDIVCEPFVALTITPATLPTGHQWKGYAVMMAAAGGLAPVTWTASGLPPGLSIGATGEVTGVPSQTGTWDVSITATDSAAHQATVVLPLTVDPTTSGTLYAWGDNTWGQVGDGTTTDRHLPAKVHGIKLVTQVVGDQNGSMALTPQETVYTWGLNGRGELGIGTSVIAAQKLTPVQVPGLSKVVALADGADSRFALKSDGTVWAWGNNDEYQLGLGVGSPDMVTSPVQIPGLTGVKAIATAFQTFYALLGDGSVWGFGWNASGQLGTAATVLNDDVPSPVKVPFPGGVKALASGFATGYALAGGRVWALGEGEFGALGNGQTADSDVPVPVTGLTNVVKIAAGGQSGYALTSNGHERAWGANDAGQLGDGTTVERDVPVAVQGLTQVTAVAASDGANGYALQSGHMIGWGANNSGELGVGMVFAYDPVPADVHNLSGVIAIAASTETGYLGTSYAIVAS
jgi:Regulator of chromosome condensation (RCC1) repeat/Putative Ig domain